MSATMKDWVVKFDVDGEVLTVRDVTDLTANPPKPRVMPVRATTMAKAIATAKALYSLAK